MSDEASTSATEENSSAEDGGPAEENAPSQESGPLQKIWSRFNLSLASLVSLVVAVLLVVLAAVAWGIYAKDPTRVAWGDYMTNQRSIGLLGLWITTVVITYVTVRVWMNDVPFGHKNVSEGWNAGERLLARHGVRLTDLPCFVVLGCPNRHQQEQWFGAKGASPPHPTSGTTPAIDWHLDKDRILIFCRDLGVYGGLLRNEGEAFQVPSDGLSANGSPELSDSSGVPNTSPSPPVASDMAMPPGSKSSSCDLNSQSQTDDGDEPTRNDETLVKEPFDGSRSGGNSTPPAHAGGQADSRSSTAIAESLSPAASSATSPSIVSPANQESTPSTLVSVMQTLDQASALVRKAQAFQVVGSSEDRLPEPLSSVDTTAYQDALTQFCMRLRAARFPHAPINGTLVFVDSKALEMRTPSTEEATQRGRLLGRAIRTDLEQMQLQLGVAAPVTTLISESDHPADYLELCRRLRQVEPDRQTALGQRFPSEQIPTVDSMNGLADNAIKQVESRIHKIFQVPRSLSQPQNYRLVRTLIRCRRWRLGLRNLMVESSAVAADGGRPGNHPSLEPGIVSGLFVASPSDSPLASGYARSVIDRMVSQQNHLTWTREEQVSWSNIRGGGRVLAAITVLLAMALTVQFGVLLFS